MRDRSNAGHEGTVADTEDADLVLDMAAFDLLPREVRDAINDCAVQFGVMTIAGALIRMNVTPTQMAAAIRRQGADVCRRDWLHTFGYDYLTGRAPPPGAGA